MKNQSSELRISNKTKAKHKHNNKSTTMPTVTCSCGAKLLVVPDLAAMDKAIKNHLSEHQNADEQFLIHQILEVASKQASP